MDKIRRLCAVWRWIMFIWWQNTLKYVGLQIITMPRTSGRSATNLILSIYQCPAWALLLSHSLLFIWWEIFTFDHFMWAVLPFRLRRNVPQIERNKTTLNSAVTSFFVNAAWMQMCEKVPAFYNVTGESWKMNEWIEMDVKMITNF